MNAEEIIDHYVSTVVKRLPRRQRVDVALELKSLLNEELAPEPGSPPPTPERARELLRGFGRPADVAARYRPPLTIIDPADSRRFLQVGLVGMVVIWLVSLIIGNRDTDALSRAQLARQWSTVAGLEALCWLGFLVVCFAAAAWARQRWPHLAEWKPRSPDRDKVNRIQYAAAIVGALVGTFILADPSFILDWAFGWQAEPGAYAAFAYDADFARTLGPAVLAMLGLHVLFLLVILVRGRWQRWTRRIDIGLTIVTCTLLTWILFTAQIFQAQPTDQLASLVIVAIVVTGWITVILKLINLRVHTALATRP